MDAASGTPRSVSSTAIAASARVSTSSYPYRSACERVIRWTAPAATRSKSSAASAPMSTSGPKPDFTSSATRDSRSSGGTYSTISSKIGIELLVAARQPGEHHRLGGRPVVPDQQSIRVIDASPQAVGVGTTSAASSSGLHRLNMLHHSTALLRCVCPRRAATVGSGGILPREPATGAVSSPISRTPSSPGTGRSTQSTPARSSREHRANGAEGGEVASRWP